MTFDDFKKHFETFGKIDTAEKFAICESQYQQHLLHIDDEKYFEPKESNSQDLVGNYERDLNQFLSIAATIEESFFFLVRPSFEPEHLLTIKRENEKYLATLTILEENYWTTFYAGSKVASIKKRINKSELSKELGDDLFTLLEKTIIEARKQNAKGIVLDGVSYDLLRYSNNKLVTVTKHSPDPQSKSGRIVFIMEELVKNFEQLNYEINAQIRTEINKLLSQPI